MHLLPRKCGSEELAGGGIFRAADEFGCSLRDDLAPFVGRARAEVDDPIGRFHYLQIVLDDDERMADRQQGLEAIDELHHIGKVKAGGRLVENEQGAVAFGGRHVACELEPLRLAAGEGVGRLAQAQIIEPHVDEQFEPRLHFGAAAEKGEGFAHGHLEHFGDIAATVFDFQNFGAVTASLADAALHEHVGQKLHVDFDVAVAVAGGAAAAIDIKAEMAWREITRAGLKRFGEHVADFVEGLDVRNGVGARRAADGALVDENDFVELAVAVNIFKFGGLGSFEAHAAAQSGVERIFHERAFARAADAGDEAEHAERKFDGDVFEIVAASAAELDPTVIGAATLADGADAAAAGEKIAGDAFGVLFHFSRRALEHHFAPALAGTWADFDNLVGCANERFFVFDHAHRVAALLERADSFDQAIDIGRVQADRGFVEHVEHVHETGAERGGEGDSLGFAAAECAQRAIEREVAQANRFEVAQPSLHLFEHGAADGAIVIGEYKSAKKGDGVLNFERAEFGDIFAADLSGQRLGTQPRALTQRAEPITAPAAEKHAQVHFIFALFEPFEKAA